MAEFDRVLVLQMLEVLADRGTRARRRDPIQPLRIRLRRGRGDDLDRLAGIEPRAQGHQFLVHARGDRVVADIGVHGVGEVQRSRVSWQCENRALGGEQIDLVGNKSTFTFSRNSAEDEASRTWVSTIPATQSRARDCAAFAGSLAVL